jgi:hypothetical protein
MQWSRVAPVETGATSLVSLLSCLMATLRVGCTGFSAGATPLVSARAANPQCNGTGLHRLKPVLRRWFLREPPIRNAMEQGCTG